MPIDLALREPLPSRTRGAAESPIRSLVLDTPLAWIAHDDRLLPGWRVVAPGLAGTLK